MKSKYSVISLFVVITLFSLAFALVRQVPELSWSSDIATNENYLIAKKHFVGKTRFEIVSQLADDQWKYLDDFRFLPDSVALYYIPTFTNHLEFVDEEHAWFAALKYAELRKELQSNSPKWESFEGEFDRGFQIIDRRGIWPEGFGKLANQRGRSSISD